MKEGPDIARVAALIGDPARADMLTALTDGRALTASELAIEAGITKQTASTHLSKLEDGGLVDREVQGRHRYFRLKDREVAGAIEALMGVAQRTPRTRTGPKDPALRKARVCYDHLAGDLGVFLFDRFLARDDLVAQGDALMLTPLGKARVETLGIDCDGLNGHRRPLCRACLDWSLRRHHLAGVLGKAILSRILEQGWATRIPGSRVIAFSEKGEHAFRSWLA